MGKYYKYKKLKIDLESEEPPKSVGIIKKVFLVLAIVLCIGLGLPIYIFSGSIIGFLMGMIVGGLYYWLGCFLANRGEKQYFEARDELIQKIKSGEIVCETRNEADYKGIIFYGLEIGTNLLHWKRGISSFGSSASLTPVSAKFSFHNKTGKTIKYLVVKLRPYNKVGDAVECTVKGVSLYDCTCTGPFESGQKYTQILENAWYNQTIENVRLEGATVEYMDGTTEVISAEDVFVRHSNSEFSDNEAGLNREAAGILLMIISGIVDVVSIFLLSTSGFFGVLTAISTVLFFVGLRMRY